MKDWVDSKGRLHHWLGVQGGKSLWQVSLTPVSRLLRLPAIAETGGGTDVAYYSDSDDGYLRSEHAVYATARSGGTVLLNQSAGVLGVGQNTSYIVYRSYVPFDTSGLPDGTIVTAASLSVYMYGDYSTTDFNVTVVEYTGGTPFGTADWNNFGDTSFGVLSTSGLAVGRITIPLNATGSAFISKTGLTKLGLRSDKDISATTPTASEYIACRDSGYSADDATYDPRLDITYVQAVEASVPLPPDATESGRTAVTFSALYTHGLGTAGLLRFQADTVGTFDSANLQADTVAATDGNRGQVTLTLTNRDVWYWRVRAESGAYIGDWLPTLTLERTPVSVEVVSPANAADCTTTPQVFTLVAYADAAVHLNVRLQVDTVATFDSADLVELLSGPTDSGVTHEFEEVLLGNQVRYWRAKAELAE